MRLAGWPIGRWRRPGSWTPDRRAARTRRRGRTAARADAGPATGDRPERSAGRRASRRHAPRRRCRRAFRGGPLRHCRLPPTGRPPADESAALLALLAGDVQGGGRERLEPCLRDRLAAALAEAVRARVDAFDGVLD